VEIKHSTTVCMLLGYRTISSLQIFQPARGNKEEPYVANADKQDARQALSCIP
jgi:hypothetical protein